jgi:hypothetical protein
METKMRPQNSLGCIYCMFGREESIAEEALYFPEPPVAWAATAEIVIRTESAENGERMLSGLGNEYGHE